MDIVIIIFIIYTIICLCNMAMLDYIRKVLKIDDFVKLWECTLPVWHLMPFCIMIIVIIKSLFKKKDNG